MDMKNRMARPSNVGVPQTTPTTTSPAATAAPRASASYASPAVAKKEKKKVPKWPFIVGLIIAIALIIGGMFYFNKNDTMINTDKYQAVFLTNGQVYFGRLARHGNYYKLSDVYYLQNKSGEKTESDGQLNSSGDVELIKLGNEVHGPEDVMIIERSQVLFFENLKNDGNVVKSIQQHQQNRK